MADDLISQRGSRTADVPNPDSPAGRQFDWVSSAFPHPDSATGQRFGWSALGLPHPASPVGKQIDWGNRKPNKLPAEVANLEAFLAAESGKVKSSIPDSNLRELYDRLLGRIRATYIPASSLGLTKEDGAVLLEKLARPVRWFDPDLQKKLQEHGDFVLASDRIGLIWEFGTEKERKDLLKNIQALEKAVYDAAAEGIQKQWENAKRSGKQQELTVKWRTQLLLEIKALSVGEVEVKTTPTTVPQATPAASGLVGALGGQGAGAGAGGQAGKTKVKHWIGVKVIDEAGQPVTDVTVNGALDDGSALVVILGPDGSYKTEKVLDATKCDFSFPGLFNVEWWPQGGSAGKADSVQAAPTVAAGDDLLSIADSLSFRNYHAIWDQSQNDALKKDRPNPNMLATGDVVQAPDKKDKVVTKAVDQTWTFVVRTKKPFKLRLLLMDKDDKPLSGKSWELKTPFSKKGTTGADGLIEITGLMSSDKAGTLEVTMSAATAAPAKPPAAAPGAPPNPPPYPPPIVPKDFKDKLPAPDFTAIIVEWDLTIGGLPPVKLKRGTLARLHNLAFACDVSSPDATVTHAVKAYQLFYLKNKNGSGIPADIEDDAGKRHDQ